MTPGNNAVSILNQMQKEGQMKSILRLAFFSLVLCGPASAQDSDGIDKHQVEMGDVLVCDTQEQVERYVALYGGDQDAAIRSVNGDQSGPRRCGVVSAAFVRGPRIDAASHGNMAFTIVPILVLGVESPEGFRAVDPALYFSVFGVTEYPV
jgi:hypothetical protein